MTTPPIGGAGWRAAAAGAHQLSPLARSTLEGARTLGATNGQHLADAIARLPDAAQRRQVLQEVAPELAPSELAATQSALRERGVDVGAPPARGGQPKANADADLALDLTQIGLDVAGLFDPTPISDGANALISIGRGDWLGAGLSAISMVPYIGDAAKLGKLGKYAQTVAKATEAVARNPALRESLEPGIRAIGKALDKVPLDKLPDSLRQQLTTLKELTQSFGQGASRATARGADNVAEGVADTARAGRSAARVGAQPQWGRYLDDITSQTGRAVTPEQQRLLTDYLAHNNPTRLSTTESKAHRADFNRVKNELITQWEQHTGQAWPRYTEDLHSANGTLVRKAGQPYDAHHIIESSYGGPAEWWNMHPARFPDQHQQGIHRAGGPASQIFP